MRVLATSREALGLRGEQLILVGPLDPAGSAVELFNERARSRLSATFDAAAAAVDVEEICRRLDGIPLAIELAAARTRTLAPSELVDRLGHRLRLLTGGLRTAPNGTEHFGRPSSGPTTCSARPADAVPTLVGVRRPVHPRGG